MEFISIFETKLKLTTRTKLERNKTEAQTFPLKFIFAMQLLKFYCLARGGLIIGCIFWFTGRWAYNRGRGLISGSLRYMPYSMLSILSGFAK